MTAFETTLIDVRELFESTSRNIHSKLEDFNEVQLEAYHLETVSKHGHPLFTLRNLSLATHSHFFVNVRGYAEAHPDSTTVILWWIHLSTRHWDHKDHVV